MPGSRVKEVRMNLPAILDSARLLGSECEYLLPVAPTLDRNFIQDIIGKRSIHLVNESLDALAHSRAGIIASGTATVEAAMMGTPFVMVYRVSSLTYLLGRSRVKVPYFAMVNLIAGRQVVPELIQQDFSSANVVRELIKVIVDGSAREQMLEGFAEVKRALRGPNQGSTHPADRAAEEILSLVST